MSFLSPALLIGLLAAAIPPLIHLILRRKAVVVQFPALEFIRRSNRKTARRFRVKQLLLMLLRSALLALLAFALARPFLAHEQSPTAVSGESDGATVVVIDAGYPMRWLLDGEALLDRARFQAEALLGDGGGTAALVVAGDRVEVPIDELTGDLAAVRREVGRVEPGRRPAALAEGVARAYELLEDRPGPRRVVVLTTPAGAAGDLPRPADDQVELLPVDVSGGAPVPNRAITGVSLRPAPEVGASHWRIDARVFNASDTAVERLPVHLEIDGAVKVRGFSSLGPGEEAVKTFYTPVDTDAAVPAEVVIAGDALAIDDRRPFWLRPAPRIRVLAVNGDPRPTPYRDELFYLERALSPTTTAGARVRLTITGADTLDRYDLDEFDVVILANHADPSPEVARGLMAFVSGGGGLWVTMGDRVEPDAANVALAGLLPRTLRTVRQAGDAAASAEGGDRQAGRPGVFARQHPVLGEIPSPETSSLASARIGRYMLLDPAPDAVGEVVIGLDDGAPFLLTREVGSGRVALLTGTIDRDWGDLPIRPDFLPLVQSTLRYLTRVAEVDTAPVLVGRDAPVPVEDPRVRRVKVQTPDGDLRVSERPSGEDPWLFAETGLPGHYRLSPDPPLPGLVALPGFAVALDPGGADLRGPRTETQAPGEDAAEKRAVALGVGRRTELWHAALGGLFVLLLGEGVLLFRRRKEAPALSHRRRGPAGASDAAA